MVVRCSLLDLVIPTMVTVSIADDLFRVICLNSEIPIISWQSQNQKSVSTSTTEAEYVSLSKSAKHFLWLKTALKDLRFSETLMAIFCDNRSAIDLAENHRISELSKHIDIHHHRVQKLVYDRTLPLMYIRMTDNLADMSTKGLSEVQLSKLRAIALGYNEAGY
jgi:hypothetical protein